MSFEIVLAGLFTGLLSGFFGIGGGTILVPLLLFIGYETKIAIGISVLQMVFSSIFGSFLNNKKGSLDTKMIAIIGFGGFFGASFSGYISLGIDNIFLEIAFLFFASFALFRMFFNPKEEKQEKKLNFFFLFLVGALIGVFSMSIGVGGSIILIPVLVGFLNIPLSKAISAGLFFVVFTSIAGFISYSQLDMIVYEDAIIIGFSSLFGVYAGIYLKDLVSQDFQRKLLIIFYLIVVVYLFKRIFL